VNETDALATQALARYGLEDAAATLCNVSENHTYRVDAHDRAYALRVHRPGYRTARQIESELQWIDALREDGAIETPTAVPADTGERVVDLGTHNVTLFEWLPGVTPDPDGEDLIDGFRTLGAVSARMHAHARAWQAPPGFDRPHWDYAHTLGRDGH
jgi:Ser/Thr protein kinase RdoA (MazF antagonist)